MEARKEKHATPTKKHIIKGKVHNWANRVFTVEKVGSSEQNVVIQFSYPVNYRVVKLSLAGLPKTDTDGTPIHWITNFAVLKATGHPAKRARYTLFLPAPHKHATFVYYDHRGLRHDKKPKAKGSKPEQHGMLQVDFSSGDPAGGWRDPVK